MLTLGFLSHHSKHLITKLVEKIINYNFNVKIIIIENSLDKELKKNLELKYKNHVKVFLPDQNLGFSRGMNKIIELSEDQFVFLNPADVVLPFECIKNLIDCIKNFQDFTLLAPTYKNEKVFKNYEEFIFSKEKKSLSVKVDNRFDLKKVDWVDGTFIINKKKINHDKIMDENIFIYYETLDMCLNFKKENKKMYVIENVKFEHLGGMSHEKKYNFEANLSRNWHYNWSKFYYFRKNSGYLYALKKFVPILFKNFSKIIYYLLINDDKKYKLKKAEIAGAMNSIFLKKSYYRPYIKTN